MSDEPASRICLGLHHKDASTGCLMVTSTLVSKKIVGSEGGSQILPDQAPVRCRGQIYTTHVLPSQEGKIKAMDRTVRSFLVSCKERFQKAA